MVNIQLPNREYIKNAIDTLPDSVVEKILEFVAFQKFSLSMFDENSTAIMDIEKASMSSIEFWNNLEDEVWDHV